MAVAKADLCLVWKVRSIIYGWRWFFKKNLVVTISEVDLYLFWKVGSVIHGQGWFLRRILWWLYRKLIYIFLEGGECHILLGTVFRGELNGGYVRS